MNTPSFQWGLPQLRVGVWEGDGATIDRGSTRSSVHTTNGLLIKFGHYLKLKSYLTYEAVEGTHCALPPEIILV